MGKTNHFTSFAVLLGSDQTAGTTGTSEETDSPVGIAKDGVSTGAIVGIVVGVVAASAVAGVGLFFYLRHQKRKENEDLGLSVVDDSELL